MEEKYYEYGTKEVPTPQVEENKSFWERHPELFTSVFLGGLTGLAILTTIGSIELIGAVAARKVVKKLKKEVINNVI